MIPGIGRCTVALPLLTDVDKWWSTPQGDIPKERTETKSRAFPLGYGTTDVPPSRRWEPHERTTRVARIVRGRLAPSDRRPRGRPELRPDRALRESGPGPHEMRRDLRGLLWPQGRLHGAAAGGSRQGVVTEALRTGFEPVLSCLKDRGL